MSTLAGIHAYRFRIPLSQPLVLKGVSHKERVGVLLERNGQWSEASPLPGFSRETIDDVVAALQGHSAPPPSLDFALSVLENPIRGPLEVPFSHLLLGGNHEVLSQARSNLGENCRAVKIKVGQRSTQEDAELVEQVCRYLPDNVSIRLDANQAWSLAEAVDFAERLADIELEYMEEPLRNPELLEEFYSQTNTKYALDETLLREPCLDTWPNATALICKPTLLGGHAAVERLAAAGKPIVFSAAFESGIGIARIVQLASQFSPDVPAGLDTLDWLSQDLLCQSPVKRGGRLSFQSGLAVDLASLEEFAISINCSRGDDL